MKLLHYIDKLKNDRVIVIKNISSIYKNNSSLALVIQMIDFQETHIREFENADQLNRAYLEVYRLLEQENDN